MKNFSFCDLFRLRKRLFGQISDNVVYFICEYFIEVLERPSFSKKLINLVVHNMKNQLKLNLQFLDKSIVIWRETEGSILINFLFINTDFELYGGRIHGYRKPLEIQSGINYKKIALFIFS